MQFLKISKVNLQIKSYKTDLNTIKRFKTKKAILRTRIAFLSLVSYSYLRKFYLISINSDLRFLACCSSVHLLQSSTGFDSPYPTETNLSSAIPCSTK